MIQEALPTGLRPGCACATATVAVSEAGSASAPSLLPRRRYRRARGNTLRVGRFVDLVDIIRCRNLHRASADHEFVRHRLGK